MLVQSKRRQALLVTLSLMLVLSAGQARHLYAQDQQTNNAGNSEQSNDAEDTRQVKLSDFTKQRPPAKQTNSSQGAKNSAGGGDSASWNASASKPAAAPTYHRVAPKPPVRRQQPVKYSATNSKPSTSNSSVHKPADSPKSTASNSPRPPTTEPTEIREVGVTVWRLRPAKSTDNGPAISVFQNGKLVALTPERIEGTAPVALGDNLRLSIESPRNGYLYVIDREQYADGRMGQPSLIFPTTSVRGGDNAVTAGRLIDIPDQRDTNPYFTLTSTQKAGQPAIVGELLTVMITPQPLPDVQIGRRPIALAPETVAKWEKEWSGEVKELLEMNGGAGQTWTVAEKTASETSRALTQAEPTPQTIYRVAAKPNSPVMLTVQLLYGQAATTGASSK